MNIPIDKTQFTLVSVEEKGAYFTLLESIGFSTANEVPGFNAYNTGYIDANGDPYPKLDEAALLFYVYRTDFHNEAVVQTQMLSAPTRDIDTVDTTGYDDVAYSVQLEINGDGWYTVYPILVPLVSVTELYYDVAQGQLIDPLAEPNIVAASDAILRDDVQTEAVHVFVTPNIERTLNDEVSDLTTISLHKGPTSKEYKSKKDLVHLIEAMLTGAHVKFNDGNPNVAQQIIEDIDNIKDRDEWR
jgi:hypothetical protein